VAVRNAGYEAFLVPSAEFDEVQRTVGGDLRVVAVDTLQEALDALASFGGDRVSLEPAVGDPAP
jgi:PDZ domain-containing secreted protein